MPNATQAQIKDRISAFVLELDKLVRRSAMEALTSALGDGAASRGPGRPAGSGRGPGRPKGSGNVEGASQAILAHVQANDGQGISQIAAGARVSLKVAKKVALKLLASGALSKSGQRRGTKYHVGSGQPAALPKAKAGKSRKKA